MQNAIGLKPGPQYNQTEMAQSMAKRMDVTVKFADAFLDMLFKEEIPSVLATGQPIILHGFTTIHVQEDREFSNPATPDPTDRIVKDKVCFHPHELLELIVKEKKGRIKEA